MGCFHSTAKRQHPGYEDPVHLASQTSCSIRLFKSISGSVIDDGLINKGHHKIIEFYDVRAAEGAARALNRSDLAGKKIKLETGRLSGARRCVDDIFNTAHVQGVGQEEFGVYNLDVQAQIALHCLHWRGFISGSIIYPTTSLSSPIGIASAATHSNHSLSRMNRHVNYGFQGLGAIHPHSLPDVHNGANNGTPYNLNTITPVVSIRTQEQLKQLTADIFIKWVLAISMGTH
ncbi:hypothetical protein ZEAMMB73_Zm00001d013726 [Zea mays]|uniref:Uncharacterized protein n=1 Tax=Zea mays TaxID=4577 RepID=A0A1D6GLQ6_MAIZE|nr:hypothetical protein ZEAMMB73_Zm00001d013726 [Zea mays]